MESNHRRWSYQRLGRSRAAGTVRFTWVGEKLYFVVGQLVKLLIVGDVYAPEELEEALAINFLGNGPGATCFFVLLLFGY